MSAPDRQGPGGRSPLRRQVLRMVSDCGTVTTEAGTSRRPGGYWCQKPSRGPEDGVLVLLKKREVPRRTQLIRAVSVLGHLSPSE